mmetsp:Transcript_122498/g.183165  ORF Transcript_122498/g.183165 Transcript_122498/m.183165 type:complete len:210 (-) Transcript_122498:1436-2065(-)
MWTLSNMGFESWMENTTTTTMMTTWGMITRREMTMTTTGILEMATPASSVRSAKMLGVPPESCWTLKMRITETMAIPQVVCGHLHTLWVTTTRLRLRLLRQSRRRNEKRRGGTLWNVDTTKPSPLWKVILTRTTIRKKTRKKTIPHMIPNRWNSCAPCVRTCCRLEWTRPIACWIPFPTGTMTTQTKLDIESSASPSHNYEVWNVPLRR